MILLILTILVLAGATVYIYNRSKWKYLIRIEKKPLQNTDDGYWKIIGPVGQPLLFTDDAMKVAHRRYLSTKGDGIKFKDSKF